MNFRSSSVQNWLALLAVLLLLAQPGQGIFNFYTFPTQKLNSFDFDKNQIEIFI
jgi:hypothetical protein